MYTGSKEGSERGKGKEEGVWRAQKEDRKCGACIGMTGDGMRQEEARPLTVETAVFIVCYLIKLLLF